MFLKISGIEEKQYSEQQQDRNKIKSVTLNMFLKVILIFG